MVTPHLALERGNIDNIESAKITLQETRSWVNRVVQDGLAFLLGFVEKFRALIALKTRFHAFINLWNDFLPIKDKTICQLQMMVNTPKRVLIKGKVIKARRRSNIEAW